MKIRQMQCAIGDRNIYKVKYFWISMIDISPRHTWHRDKYLLNNYTLNIAYEG